ncbi:MAG: hypothetical protein IPH57_11590 [Saprospiraceae bacterium]|nr:hypothetical protein [Saprospiraceae bacterium]
MKRLEKVIIGLIIGFTFPLLFGLLSVITWFYLDKSESRVLIYLTTGIVLGLIIDFKFLQNWIKHRFDLPLWFISGIYIFYNICTYGFFMGFPVFNILMGLIAGYYFGNRIISNKIQSQLQSKQINQVSLFTGLIMTLICISSGIIGLTDKTIGENIQGMLGLDFEITKTMI